MEINLPWYIDAVIVAAPILWALFKKSEIGRDIRASRHAWLLECIAVGVAAAYQAVVKPEKERVPNEKMRSLRKVEAKNYARAIAVKMAKTKNKDLLGELGAEFVDKYIEDAIVDAKRRGGKLPK